MKISQKKQLQLQVMVLPGIIFLVIFAYFPMYGILIAFQRYTVLDTFNTAVWVGFENFKIAFNDPFFWTAVYNTLVISMMKLLFGFLAPIILAIMIFEAPKGIFRKTVQSISYLPHFLSWIILGGMLIQWLSVEGLINNLLMLTGVTERPVEFLITPNLYWWIAVFSDIWKGAGWGTILYLATMSGVDPNLFEAARIDGAGKMRQIWHITLPSISHIITLMLVLSVSGLLGSNFDQTMVLQNSLNVPKSEVINTYVYKIGIAQGDFSYGTTVGLGISIVSLILLTITHQATKRFNEQTIF